MQIHSRETMDIRVLGALVAVLVLSACVSVEPLEQARSDFSEQLIRTDGHLVYAAQSGHGDPVVLIHGFGASSYSWRKVAPELAERHRVVAIDLYGFGWTDRPQDRQHYSRDGQVGLVLGVMDALGIEAAHIVGHSYGGAVSMALAADHPERVRSMVLVDSAAVDYPVNRKRWFAPIRLFDWIYVRGLALRTGVARRAFEHAYYDDSQVTDELIEAYLERLRVEGVAGAYRALSWPLPASQRPREIHYQELAVPTLVLWGAQDRIVSAEVGRYHAGLLPDCRFVAIEGVGHSPMEEKPAEFLKEVIAFLDEIERRSTSTPTTASHGAM
jgi:pimeloyl-ACP methyl ester carboxylesterase